MADARSAKWKVLKNKSFILLPPDADSLRQHCLRANYLAYIIRHPSLKSHPSPLGHGWELVGGRCRPVRHTRPSLPRHLPAVGPSEEIEEDDSEEGDHGVVSGRDSTASCDSNSSSSDSECSESNSSFSDL